MPSDIQTTFIFGAISIILLIWQAGLVVAAHREKKAAKRERDDAIKAEAEERKKYGEGVEICSMELSPHMILEACREYAFEQYKEQHGDLPEYDLVNTKLTMDANLKLAGVKISLRRRTQIMKGKLSLVKG